MKTGDKAARYDPTRTGDIVTRWTAGNRKRVQRFGRQVATVVRQLLDEAVLGDGVVTTNATRPYRYRTSPALLDRFRHWLSVQASSGLLELPDLPSPGKLPARWWAGQLVASAYRRGMTRAVAEMQKAGISKYPNVMPPEHLAPDHFGTADWDKGLELRPGVRNYVLPDGSRASLTAAFNTPVHAERVALLYGRTFEGMRGLTETMKSSLASILAQGMVDGKSPYEMAREMTKTMDITLARANMIARTEIIRAHHVGAITTYQQAGVMGVKTQAELITVAGDTGDPEELNVCPKCIALQNQTAKKPLSLEEALPLIPVHPNCRCMVIPVVTEIVD